MSEPKPTLTTMAIAAAQADADTNEFVVHKKHGCDKCYTKPIIGKRFRSSALSDYDLCAACFEAYDGPEIGLAEVLLARDREVKNSFVLKLKVDSGTDSQTRRIKVSDLWDSSTSKLSFTKLATIASDFAFKSQPADKLEKLIVTYIDEDGDKITMSSDDELTDAFRQTLKKMISRPFRINATFPQDKREGKSTPPEVKNIVDAKTPSIEMKKVAEAKATENTGCPFKGSVRQGPSIKMGGGKIELAIPNQLYEKEFFIHARHTCDGCSKTPIIGTRYHATKIPDFDLCECCFKEYKGEHLDFKPETFDRDRPMQHKWLKKQLSMTPQMENLAEFLKKLKEAKMGPTTAKKPADAPHSAPSPNEPSVQEDEVDGENPKSSIDSDDVKPTTVEEKVGGVPSDEIKSSGSPRDDENARSFATNEPPSPSKSSIDGSFLDDADGNGSIAEVIGRTLDVCVQAMDDVVSEIEKADIGTKIAQALPKESVRKAVHTVAEELEKIDIEAKITEAVALESLKSSGTNVNDLKDTTHVVADAISVASSMMSSMTDIIKKMEECNKSAQSNASASVPKNQGCTNVPSVVSGATILPSVDNTNNEEAAKEDEKSDGSNSDGEDWSVVEDERKQAESDEALAKGLSMIGSSLFDSDMVSTKPDENKKEDSDSSSSGSLSAVVLARWEAELKQLHDIGFLDDRKNIDALEHLEASHMGVDSVEKVTVNAVVEHLLANDA